MITRREALLTMGTAAAGALIPRAVNAKESAKMKVGLYSITYLGVWYRGDALSLEELVKRAKEYGYNGYFGYELCHPLPVVEGQTVGREFADKNARLACEYLKSVIAETG